MDSTSDRNPRDSSSPLEFGRREIGQIYQPRPGSYAVIFDDAGNVAVLRTGQGCFLPGGGAQGEETPEATLRREILEECGYEIEIVAPLGFAIEYVAAVGEGHFAKQCSFFRATFVRRLAAPTDVDHELVWLPAVAAQEALTHASQRWAMSVGRKASQ